MATHGYCPGVMVPELPVVIGVCGGGCSFGVVIGGHECPPYGFTIVLGRMVVVGGHECPPYGFVVVLGRMVVVGGHECPPYGFTIVLSGRVGWTFMSTVLLAVIHQNGIQFLK